jgi:hypothetical protein
MKEKGLQLTSGSEFIYDNGKTLRFHKIIFRSKKSVLIIGYKLNRWNTIMVSDFVVSSLNKP